MSTYPPIPYGWAAFAAIRRERALYVDIREVRDGLPRLGIPNRTVWRLAWSRIRGATAGSSSAA